VVGHQQNPVKRYRAVSRAKMFFTAALEKRHVCASPLLTNSCSTVGNFIHLLTS
jgi:hypothetical protein